jgi:hypothetical protein
MKSHVGEVYCVLLTVDEHRQLQFLSPNNDYFHLCHLNMLSQPWLHKSKVPFKIHSGMLIPKLSTNILLHKSGHNCNEHASCILLQYYKHSSVTIYNCNT